MFLARYIVAMVTYCATKLNAHRLGNDWADFKYHEFGINQYREVIMNLHNLCLRKCWKLVQVTLSNFKIHEVVGTYTQFRKDTQSKQ